MIKFSPIRGLLSLAIAAALLMVAFSAYPEDPCLERFKAQAARNIPIDEDELRSCYSKVVP